MHVVRPPRAWNEAPCRRHGPREEDGLRRTNVGLHLRRRRRRPSRRRGVLRRPKARERD